MPCTIFFSFNTLLSLGTVSWNLSFVPNLLKETNGVARSAVYEWRTVAVSDLGQLTHW